MVYDFGGGTLDVSLLHVSDGFVDVMGLDGDDRLGGAGFDAAIAQDLVHSVNFSQEDEPEEEENESPRNNTVTIESIL